jgi:hypothetical protein
MRNDLKPDLIKKLQTGITLFALSGMTACTQQQYYEGLKAGHRSNCLNYPEAEYDDCVEETNSSYDEYQAVREKIVGNQQ